MKSGPRSILTRVDIPRQHLWGALLTSLSAAFLLCGYEAVRSVSNTLYKATYGAENLPIVMALMPIGVFLILSIYGRTLSLLGARRTLFVTTISSGIFIFGCFLALHGGSRLASGVLYIFREAYVVLMIEQYWSFLNSTLSEKSAKKLNGPIIGVSSLGSIAGGMLLHHLAIPLGTQAMLLIAAFSALPAAMLSEFAYRTCGEPSAPSPELTGAQGHLGLSLFRRGSPLLVLLFIIVMTQMLSTVLDLRFQGILQQEIPDADQQTAFSGGYFALLNGVAAFFQFFGVPLALRFVSIRTIHTLIPLIHIAAALYLFSSPSLVSAGAAFLLFKSLDYSLFRASKEILYIPLSFNARYRAKGVIDTFGYRFGKGGTSFGVFLLQHFGLAAADITSPTAVAASLVWFIATFPFFRLYKKKASVSSTAGMITKSA